MKTALNLTLKLLTDLGQGPTSLTNTIQSKNTIQSFEVLIFKIFFMFVYFYQIKIWSIRFQLFMALKMYSNLLEELVPFEDLDAPDTYLQYYSEYKPQTGFY